MIWRDCVIWVANYAHNHGVQSVLFLFFFKFYKTGYRGKQAWISWSSLQLKKKFFNGRTIGPNRLLIDDLQFTVIYYIYTCVCLNLNWISGRLNVNKRQLPHFFTLLHFTLINLFASFIRFFTWFAFKVNPKRPFDLRVQGHPRLFLFVFISFLFFIFFLFHFISFHQTCLSQLLRFSRTVSSSFWSSLPIDRQTLWFESHRIRAFRIWFHSSILLIRSFAGEIQSRRRKQKKKKIIKTFFQHRVACREVGKFERKRYANN